MDLQLFRTYAYKILSPNIEKNRETLLNDLASGLLKEVITKINSNENDLIEVANRSYNHNNGFCKILLLDERPKFSVRFHLWPQYKIQNSHIHNHPWDMSGILISGSYDWEIVSISYSDIICNDVMYECEYLNDYSGHIFKRKYYAEIVELETVRIKSHEIFNFMLGKYHKILKNNNLPVDSIVITGESNGFKANVVTSEILDDNVVKLNDPMKAIELRDTLIKFIDRNLVC